MRRALFLFVLAAGCGSSAPGPSTFAAINMQILQPSCTFSSCHSPEGAKSAGHLDLKTDPYASMVNVLADNAMAKGEGKNRVTPGDAANSFLYIKLTLPPGPSGVCRDEKTGYGGCMPQTSTPLEQNQIDGIKKWIDGGALAN